MLLIVGNTASFCQFLDNARSVTNSTLLFTFYYDYIVVNFTARGSVLYRLLEYTVLRPIVRILADDPMASMH